MGDQPDFARSFYNLEGDLKGERKKSLFKLLRTEGLFSNDKQLENALRNINPKTCQENLFYIDTLIYFKRTEQLLEIIKQGNEIFISKILNQAWFCKLAFEEVDADKLVNDFLPCLSYAIRKKLITKLCKHWSENKIDLLYDALDKKYGQTVATSILQRCSDTKIKSTIIDNEIKLRPSQVLNLFNKSEDLFKFYLNYINQLTGSRYDESKVLNRVAIKSPQLFLQLQQDKKIQTHHVGKRTTKNILNLVKEDMPNNHEFYFRLLKNSVVVRKLGKNFDLIYKQQFPKVFTELSIYSSGNRLLAYYSKNRRWELFLRTCNERFTDKSLNEILLSFKSIKALNPPQDIIETWAEIHYQRQMADSKNYLIYYQPTKAIAAIKERINVTSDIYERRSLVCLMIRACEENKDLVALEHVLQYICFRHRNEDTTFREELLREVENKFNLKDFNEKHWKYIDEQLQILKIQKSYRFSWWSSFVEGRLEYLLKNNENEYKKALIEFIKDMTDDNSNRQLSHDDLSLKKQIYTDMCAVLPVALDKNSPDLRSHRIRFLIIFLVFSKSNPDYCVKITDCPDLVSQIQETFAKTEKFDLSDKELIPHVIYYNVKFPQHAVPHNANIFVVMRRLIEEAESVWPFQWLFDDLICKKDRNEAEKDIFSFYYDNFFEKYPLKSIVSWLLRNEPKSLTPHVSKLVESNTRIFGTLEYKLFKQYSHLDLDQRVCESYKKKLDEGDTSTKKESVQALCALLRTDDFAKLVLERYVPKKDKLDLLDEETRNVYNIQCEFAKTMAKVPDPYKMLPVITKFCKGDYLQSALPSLYSAFYRSPERLLYSYVEVISKQAVSARKHALFLSCEVLDKQHTLHMLKNSNEPNVSGQKHRFSATLKYFLKNPSQDLFDMVMETLSTIDVNDKETLDSLKDIVVPTKYRAQYIEKCWRFFIGLQSKGVKIAEYIEKLLNYMQGEVLTSLPKRFIIDIMENHFSITTDRLGGIDDFVVRVLKTRTSERNETFKVAFYMAKNLPIRVLLNFFNSFMNEAQRDKNTDIQLLCQFSEVWNEHFDIISSFKERLSIKLVLLKFESRSTEEFASMAIKYLEELITQFGYQAYQHFNDEIGVTIPTMKDVDQYSFYLGVLKYKVDQTTCTLVLDNMPHVNEYHSEEVKNVYNDILNMLKDVDIPIVRVNYNIFLR